VFPIPWEPVIVGVEGIYQQQTVHCDGRARHGRLSVSKSNDLALRRGPVVPGACRGWLRRRSVSKPVTKRPQASEAAR
jgi:hypothetical protein